MFVHQQPTRRKAAYVVEASIVISMVMLLLFGILEYGRFIFTLQVVENAAREGARMAIAHTNDKTTADVVQRVNEKLTGASHALHGLDVSVTGIVLRPKDSSEVTGQELPDWTEAGNTDGIAVQVRGTYRPILPSFILLPAEIPINVRTVMYSEGN